MFNNRKITIKSKISIERFNRKIEILKKSLYIFFTPNFIIIIIITTIVIISITINKTIVHFECYNECDSDLFAITKEANYFLKSFYWTTLTAYGILSPLFGSVI